MTTKNLWIACLFLGIFLMLSGNVSATNVCYCDSCESCTNRLNNSNCKEVRLTKSIINHTGTCIDNPANFNNKIFDCQGNIIDGRERGYWEHGIYLDRKSNNTIRNCIITDFWRGIYLWNSSNNILINNMVNNNSYGINLWWHSSNNILTNNTANNNIGYGIYLYYSSNNTLTNNTASSNYYGISLFYSSNNILTNNTMNDNTYNFNIYGWKISHFYQDIRPFA